MPQRTRCIAGPRGFSVKGVPRSRRYGVQTLDSPAAPATDVSTPASLPLCVDLDGTLIHTDLLYESFVAVVTARPWLLFLVPFWLLRGRPYLKARLAERCDLTAALLPYDQRVLDYIAGEKAHGRTIALVTASTQRLARQVADHLGLFDIVLASDEHTNLSRRRKAAALMNRFGAFEYVGNAHDDLAVWEHAARVAVANPPRSLRRHLARTRPADVEFLRHGGVWKGLAKALRPHQWSKNLLVFVPIITANQLTNVTAWGAAALAFAAFCAIASSIYIINDLTDLAADRAHPRKRRRPFASGTVPLSPAVLALGPVLLVLGMAGAVYSGVALPLCGYAATSLGYSIWLKKLPLVDVFILAFLYVSRMIVGGLATGGQRRPTIQNQPGESEQDDGHHQHVGGDRRTPVRGLQDQLPPSSQTTNHARHACT